MGQTTSFTYQGRLTDGGTAANGTYDLQFALWDSNSGGAQIGTTQSLPTVAVSAGIFTVQLDFGANSFPGAPRFLEIGARLGGSPSFTTLSPRQQITSTPYAIRSLNASTADAVTVTGVPGGSGNYIQNNPPSQQAGNFNISGNGTVAGTLSGTFVNATQQYNLGGNVGGFRVLGNGQFGSTNLFVGANADRSNTPDVITNATAIGANARVDQSNALVLGSIAGTNGATASVNVGIGTTTPQNTLHVKGGTLIETSGSGGNIQLGTPNSETGMSIVKAGGLPPTGRADLRFDGSTLKLVAGVGTGIPSATNGLAITTTGNVGIGTTSPAHRLSVIGGPSWTSSLWNGSMEFANTSAIGWQANTAGWHFGIGQTNGGLVFFQTSSALGSTLSPSTYDMVLTDGGLVGIGTASPDNLLTVNGAADKPGGGSWGTFSDERLKNLKGQFTPGLKAVMQLKPLRYEYKPDNALGLKLEGEQVGFSAQAVQRVIPEAVTRNDKGYLLVNNDPILWTMLNAIKEQQSQIETLRTQNAALNARLRSVERIVRKKVGSARRRH